MKTTFYKKLEKKGRDYIFSFQETGAKCSIKVFVLCCIYYYKNTRNSLEKPCQNSEWTENPRKNWNIQATILVKSAEILKKVLGYIVIRVFN